MSEVEGRPGYDRDGGAAPGAVSDAGGAEPLSVLQYGQESTNHSWRPWTRQQKRIYWCVQTALLKWESEGFMIRWVMLSSSVDSDPSLMATNHARLLRRIEREFGYGGVEYIVIQTAEGEKVPVGHRGVLHVLWAWRVPPGWRGKHFYVPQAWLSDAWRDLHGASYVWIAPYRPGLRSRGRVSHYVVSQYCSGQSALVRYFWSWRRTFGRVSATRLWNAFRREFPRRVTLNRWRALISGESIALDRWVFSLSGLRAGRVYDLVHLREGPAPAALRRRLGMSRA